MRYQGSEAYSMGAPEAARPRAQARPRPSFEVVSGGGLDARARRGVSPQFVARVRSVLLVAGLLIAIGIALVALTSATVGVLQANSDLKEEIETAQTLSNDLRIERSVLSSNTRIARIATQNYGMVLSASHATVSLDDTSAEAAQASDGDAAQTAAEASGTAAVN